MGEDGMLLGEWGRSAQIHVLQHGTYIQIACVSLTNRASPHPESVLAVIPALAAACVSAALPRVCCVYALGAADS